MSPANGVSGENTARQLMTKFQSDVVGVPEKHPS
jgi:hypothetical protein